MHYIFSVKSIEQLSQDVIDAIDGLIAGDGYVSDVSLRKKKHVAFHRKSTRLKRITGGTCYLQISQAENHRGWVEWWHDFLVASGFNCSDVQHQKKGGTQYIKAINKTTKVQDQYVVYTRQYPCFDTFRHRWYVDRRKIIPRDINVSPMFMAQHYMGDGTISDKYRLQIATHGFPVEDVKWLVKQINDRYQLNFKCYLNTRPILKGVITHLPFMHLSGVNNINRFLRLTSPYMVDCMKYKWRITSNTKQKKLADCASSPSGILPS